MGLRRVFRGYLARRFTARRRHRYWTKQRASRLVFLKGLDVANMTTYQVNELEQ